MYSKKKKKTVKKVVSKKETTAPEPDKSKVLTTKGVKILLSKTDDTGNKTKIKNKDEIKLALQIEGIGDGEESVEKTDKPKFKCVQKARHGTPLRIAHRVWTEKL